MQSLAICLPHNFSLPPPPPPPKSCIFFPFFFATLPPSFFKMQKGLLAGEEVANLPRLLGKAAERPCVSPHLPPAIHLLKGRGGGVPGKRRGREGLIAILVMCL